MVFIMMHKHADLLATTGDWVDDAGKRHKRRSKVGIVMKDDVSGKLSIRLELLPVGPVWSGWLAVVPVGDEVKNEQ